MVEVLDVLGVHLEEWGEADDDVADSAAGLVGGGPGVEALAKLERVTGIF